MIPFAKIILKTTKVQRWTLFILIASFVYALLVVIMLVQHLFTQLIGYQSGILQFCTQLTMPDGSVDYEMTENTDYGGFWDLANTIFTLGLISNKPSRKHQMYNSKQKVKSLKKLGLLSQTIKYNPFTLSPPRFVDPSDEIKFYEWEENIQHLRPPPESRLLGVIEAIPAGYASYNIDCGWNSQMDQFKQLFNWVNPQVDIVVPLFVPQGNTFQHFIDGVLPKIIQAYDIIMMPGVKVAITIPRDQIVFEMLHKLNINCDKIIFADQIVAHTQLNTCITPPIHPELWKKASRLLGVPERLSVPVRQANVILLTRALSYNGGRNMINYAQTESYLRERYGRRLHIFQGGYNLESSLELFGKACLIIGVHGGAFYNINYSPKELHVVEILPIFEDGNTVPGIAHTIVWHMAQMLGQTYWRIHEVSVGEWGDVNININKLNKALDRIDQIQLTKNPVEHKLETMINPS